MSLKQGLIELLDFSAWPTQAKNTILIFMVLVSISLVVVYSVWLLKRMSISEMRHSLNYLNSHYEEKPKDRTNQLVNLNEPEDELNQNIRSCEVGKNYKMVILENDSNFVKSNLRETDYVYRYVVINADAIEDKDCISRLLSTLTKQSYNTQITFSKQGKKVLSIDNIDKEKNHD